ncbi:MAG: large conductance mechanosensitive channel protein MscL [Verrucomicrobiota bacterium]
MLKEFKEFAFKGNLIDMAVGIIIGAAFASVVGSLIKDVIMPPIAHLAGGVNWENRAYVIGGGELDLDGKSEEEIEKITAEKPTVRWGKFLTELITFLIISMVIFILVKKVLAAMNVKTEADDPGPSAEEELLTEIRDLLKKGK